MGGTGNRVLILGLFGAAGCLLGWLVGESYLAAEEATKPATAASPSLVSNLKVPSPEPDLPSDEFRKRLNAAKAQTGDIQISLIWDDKSDLDLYCIAPSGEISRATPTVGGGYLDVQTNLDDDPPAGAVENIYWSKGAAPPGKYEVYVGFIKQSPKGAATVDYRVSVLIGTRRTEISKKITWQPGFSRGPKDPVFAFEVKSGVELYTPSEVTVIRGRKLLVPVVVRREFFQGTVEVKAVKENLPEGVSVEPVVIPADKDGGELILEATTEASVGTTPLVLEVTRATPSGGRELLVTAKSSLTVAKPPVKFTLWALVSAGVWTAFLAVGLTVSVVVGWNKQQGRWLFASGPVPMVLVVLGAAGAGLLAGAVGQTALLLLLWADASAPSARLGLVPGWVLLGALLGRGVAMVIPNVATRHVMLTGAGVGLFGALMVWAASDIREWVGRFAGAGVFGFGLGLTVGVVGVVGHRASVRPLPPGSGLVASRPQPISTPAQQPQPLPGPGANRTGRPSGPPSPPPPALPPGVKPQPAPATTPQVSSALAPTAKPPASAPDSNDGLPMSMEPPSPPRATATSILDDGLSEPTPQVTKPPAPAVVSKPPTAATGSAPAKSPVASSKSPTLGPPLPPPPRPPAAVVPKVTDADSCPNCGRKIVGAVGDRYCMVCDRKF